MARLWLAMLLGLLALAGPGLVRPVQGGQAGPDAKALTPEQRGRIRENLERWRQLPPEEKERIRDNYQHWKQLSPEERETLRRRFEDYQKLPPEDRQRLREEFRRQTERAPADRPRSQVPAPPRPGQRPTPGER
jgi:hypothetical protein